VEAGQWVVENIKDGLKIDFIKEKDETEKT
jgi:hypothetical protein